MDFTLSEHAETTVSEREIEIDWLGRTMNEPELSLPHESDPALCYAFRRIPEYGNRVLRVIFNAEKKPAMIVTAYFDRSMKDNL